MRAARLIIVGMLIGVLVATLAGCPSEGSGGSDSAPHTLLAYPNPFGPDDPLWSAPPHRDKPLEVVVTPAGDKAYVSLQGIPDDPGHHVAVVDLAKHRLIKRIAVGSSPTGLALHPDGRVLVVLNRFSDFVSVIDTARDRVVAQIPADYYAIEASFTPDGKTLFLTNRWRDAVAVWDVAVEGADLTVTARLEPGIPVGANPRDLAMSPDGATVAVAALTGLTVSLIDVASRTERARVALGSPANGVVWAGRWLFVATTSASTHHEPLAGPDTNGDGVPGDGTPNVNFQDLQNELAVIDGATGEIVHRYTSDTISGKDYRDVDPRDLARHGDLLPPADTWIVGGALPEQLALVERPDATWLMVTYSASDQVQRFAVDRATGALTAGPTWATVGHNPHGIAAAADGQVLVAHRLSETVGLYDASSGAVAGEVEVGDLSAGAFPATDAEIGELFNYVTAPFTVDGDQSCAHCHREDGNIDKAFSMPLTIYAGVGRRMTMAYRGAADSRPWFFESAMDETNFLPVINEFARIENFCCSDYTMWPNGVPAGCATSPPPECGTAPNAGSLNGFDAARPTEFASARPTAAVNRDQFYLASARRVIGRERSFGDGLYFTDPISGGRSPVALNFDGITRALGLFLLSRTRLLPNPNPRDRAAVRRGEALFESPETGCVVCHPPPAYGTSDTIDPFGVGIRFPPVVTPMRREDGTNLDLFASGFVKTFPQSAQDSCEAVCGVEQCAAEPAACDTLRQVRFGAPPLRGIWDRAPSMLHDGRAHGLREVLCTPGHPALRAGETGYNERDGIIDSHGGTSQLTPAQIDDMVTFLRSL